jgi:hypothetical protein
MFRYLFEFHLYLMNLKYAIINYIKWFHFYPCLLYQILILFTVRFIKVDMFISMLPIHQS